MSDSTIPATPSITLYVDCALRVCAPIELPASATGRDVYITVSAQTNLSRKLFKLFCSSKLVHDSLIPLTDYGIISGTRITLAPNIQSGSNLLSIDPARGAIRKYVYSLPQTTVSILHLPNATLRGLNSWTPQLHKFQSVKRQLFSRFNDSSMPRSS